MVKSQTVQFINLYHVHFIQIVADGKSSTMPIGPWI